MIEADADSILRSPRQASVTFSLDGKAAPRLKNLFYVRFVRGSSASSQSSWDKDLGFLVKSVERPAIQPITEELHQYNKKRQVYTGYKANPVRISLYDTADSLCMQMWSEYSRYYFGDFGHRIDTTDWNSDITANTFNDSDGKGFGFNPSGTTTLSATTGAADVNAQFFFDRIQVFQVWNRQFIQFDLINPKITAFDPDDFSYEDSAAALINLSVAFEAVVLANNGAPQPLSASSVLSEAFKDKRLDGDVYAVPSIDMGTAAASFAAEEIATAAATTLLTTVTAPVAARAYGSSDAAGALLAYGAYDFGSIAAQTAIPASGRILATDLAVQALANAGTASALSVASPSRRSARLPARLAPGLQVPTSIDPAVYDVARSAIASVAQGRSDMEAAYMVDELVQAILASGGNNPRDEVAQIRAQDPDTPATADGRAHGVALTPDAYGVMNARRTPIAQICYNRDVAKT